MSRKIHELLSATSAHDHDEPDYEGQQRRQINVPVRAEQQQPNVELFVEVTVLKWWNKKSNAWFFMIFKKAKRKFDKNLFPDYKAEN